MDRAVLATARELFEARHYPGVVALIDDALEAEPEHVPLLLLRARARFALHRDLEAQADLRDVIRLDPQCPTAYRLLGELAARRSEYESAAIFFREALRLDDTDETSRDWLAIVTSTLRPAARFPRGTSPPEPPKQLARSSKLAIKSKPMMQTPVPELPGFGDYLVEQGILTRERLRAAQAYQRSMKVQLTTAIVTLGLATPQRIEWAAVSHQSHLARQR
ncbi:MAG TPA: tetratricopeptide repeat protein [Kofleriaceae bacterium]